MDGVLWPAALSFLCMSEASGNSRLRPDLSHPNFEKPLIYNFYTVAPVSSAVRGGAVLTSRLY